VAARCGPAWIIIVTGPPCGGKSRLAAGLRQRLDLPLLTKDGIKERLFDALGWGSPEWSEAVNRATNALLLDTAELLLATRRPFIVESNLRPERDGEAFAALQDRWDFAAIQVHCSAQPEALLERFRLRWRAGRRHPGHADDRAEPAIAESIRAGAYAPMALRGPLVRVDTTDDRYVDHEAIALLLEMHIRNIKAGATA